MTEQATENLVAQLPEPVYVVVTYYPHLGMASPVWVPLPLEGHFGMPVFGERELAEEFVASPNFDMPYIIKEITLEQFIRAGEAPVAPGEEIFFMIDPAPPHEWRDVEAMGFLAPIADALRLLREELGL